MSAPSAWLVKRNGYVHSYWTTEAAARDQARQINTEYQTDDYYAEEYQ